MIVTGTGEDIDELVSKTSVEIPWNRGILVDIIIMIIFLYISMVWNITVTVVAPFFSKGI